MNELLDRVDVPATGVPVSLEVSPTNGYTTLVPHMLERLADQLAHMLETLKVKEANRPSQAQIFDQGDAILRNPKTRGLSCRQVEILCKVAEGMSNKEIAAQLHVSDQTVKNHMTHILDRLYANDRTHAVVLAYRMGLLDLEGGPSKPRTRLHSLASSLFIE